MELSPQRFSVKRKYLFDTVIAVSYTHLLKEKKYASSVIHNNNASFYDRDAVFSNLGFDNFISIENMDIKSRNEAGWAKDSVLTRYCLLYTSRCV